MKKVLCFFGVMVLLCTLTACGSKKENSKNEKKEQIKIEFDTDGGTAVETIITSKNNSITLPTTTKEGFNFTGWFDDSTQVTNETKFTKSTKLTAKWEEIKKDVKNFIIVFDTKGGNEINGLTLECDKPIKLPAKPIRKGYTFVNWEDKNGKVINDGALLTCEDITLTAVWKEDKKEEDSNSNSNKTITYSCDKGYTLEGKTCKKVEDATKKCPNGTIEYGDICVKITANNYRQPQQKSDNTYYCASKEYIYISNPSSYAEITAENGGCFPKFNKVSYCNLGELDGGKCYIEIAAKKTEK